MGLFSHTLQVAGVDEASSNALFLFLYFLFPFFIKIYFRFGNLQKYTSAAPLPGGRGLSAKKRGKKLQTGPWEPAARQPGGPPPRPPGWAAAGPPPLYKGVGYPSPLICLAKYPEKKKREGGRERRGEGEAKR